jgi:hypothetical protein
MVLLNGMKEGPSVRYLQNVKLFNHDWHTQYIFGTKSQENTSLCYPEEMFFDSQGIPAKPLLSSYPIMLV